MRRRRLAGLLRFAVFLLLIFVAVWAGVRVAYAGTDAGVYTGHEYVVRDGDTLWKIAAQEYGPGADVRRAVYKIRAANRLDGSAVPPGDRLTLPYLEEWRAERRPCGILAPRRDVAQPGSAPALGAGGRRFESARPDSHSPRRAGVAQLVEHQPSKLRVAGSKPVSRSTSLLSAVVHRAPVAQLDRAGDF